VKPERLRGEDYGPRTYFVTFCTADRRRLFQVDLYAKFFSEVLQNYRKAGKFLLHEFVIMPDHIHLLLTPTGITLERAVQYIKGGSSHDLRKRFGIAGEIWQRGFTDHRIRTGEDYERHRDYIHENASRAHHVLRTSEGVVDAPPLTLRG
jgi:REP-associated tyrosine transposase